MVPKCRAFLSINAQARYLQKDRPGSCSNITPKSLTWEAWVQPTPLSERYRVRMIYHLGVDPNISILEPKLILPEGQKKLPHMYCQKYLCLHYPKYNEWNPKRRLSTYIVPWISEWLYHYEVWLVTGEWRGGGIEH